jgi:hypothetical protein
MTTSHIVFLILNDLMVFNITFNNITVISWRSVLLTGQCFSPGTPVSPTNKTYYYDIADILLKPNQLHFQQKTHKKKVIANFSKADMDKH